MIAHHQCFAGGGSQGIQCHLEDGGVGLDHAVLEGEDKIAGVVIGDPSSGYLSCAQGDSVVTIHDISLNATADTTFTVWFQ